MPAAAMDDIGACVFDAYGTLFDVAAAAMGCRDVLGDKTEALAELWRTKQLEYTWLRSLMDEYVDFWHVTASALDFAMSKLDLGGSALRARLMELYLRLDAYGEVKEVLNGLKKADIKTAILSNGSLSMLFAAVGSAGIQKLIDEIISVDSIRLYKPHRSVYQMAVDRLNVAAGNICFMSSNTWDVAGAANFGFRSVWINRSDQQLDRIPGKPEHEIPSLAKLCGLLGV